MNNFLWHISIKYLVITAEYLNVSDQPSKQIFLLSKCVLHSGHRIALLFPLKFSPYLASLCDYLFSFYSICLSSLSSLSSTSSSSSMSSTSSSSCSSSSSSTSSTSNSSSSSSMKKTSKWRLPQKWRSPLKFQKLKQQDSSRKCSAWKDFRF